MEIRPKFNLVECGLPIDEITSIDWKTLIQAKFIHWNKYIEFLLRLSYTNEIGSNNIHSVHNIYYKHN